MEAINFAWSKCSKYRLIKNDTVIEADGKQFVSYRPLENFAALYAVFAAKKATPRGMLEFCNNFGLPGGVKPEAAVPTGYNMIMSTRVDVLLAHHKAMSTALRKFEAGDPSGLLQHCNGIEGLGMVQTILALGEDGRISMVFNPPDLIRAMWLQFAQHACWGARLLRCERCSTPFVVGTGTDRRSTKKFCSNACKVAAYKKRQDLR